MQRLLISLFCPDQVNGVLRVNPLECLAAISFVNGGPIIQLEVFGGGAFRGPDPASKAHDGPCRLNPVDIRPTNSEGPQTTVIDHGRLTSPLERLRMQLEDCKLNDPEARICHRRGSRQRERS